MTGTVGGDLRVVLTLDGAGQFQVGLRNIGTETGKLKAELTQAKAELGQFERLLAATKSVTGAVQEGFGALSATVDASTGRMVAAIKEMAQFGLGAKKAKQGTDELTAATDRSGKSMTKMQELVAMTKASMNEFTAASVKNAATLIASDKRRLDSVKTTEAGVLAADAALARSLFSSAAAAGFAERNMRLYGSATPPVVANVRHLAREVDGLSTSLRGLGELWMASKIEKGFMGAVHAADQFERASMNVTGLNLPANETKEFFDKAFGDAKLLQFVSGLDMIRARMAAIGGLGANHVKEIDATLSHAVMVAGNIGYITGDTSKQGMENMVRNLYGLGEARQQTQDPEAMKRTFDLMQKIYVATGRKIDIQDLETFFRRVGSGARTMTDDAILRLIAFLDQAKVSGSQGSSGGAGGVSTVGTMIKMFQAYGTGKGLSGKALTEFDKLGLLGVEGVEMEGSRREVMKQLKHGGLNLGNLSLTDPVLAMKQIADAARNMMTTDPKAKKEYFGDGPINDETFSLAFTRLVNKLGFSTTAVTALSMAGNAPAMNRSEDQRRTAIDSMGAEAMHEARMKTFGMTVERLKASLTDLGMVIGKEVMPAVIAFLNGMTAVIRAAQKFAEENPIALKMTAIALAAGGVVLAFSGFTKIFGLVGSLSGILRGLLGTSAAVGTAAKSSVDLWGVLGGKMGGWVNAIGGWFRGIGGFIGSVSGIAGKVFGELGYLFATAGSGVAKLASGVAAATMFIGRSFLRLIPVLGWALLAWDLGKLLGQFEVGGHAISDWLEHWIDGLVFKVKDGWLGLKEEWAKFSRFGMKVDEDTVKAIQAERAALREQYQGKTQKAGFDTEYNEAAGNAKFRAMEVATRNQIAHQDKLAAEKDAADKRLAAAVNGKANIIPPEAPKYVTPERENPLTTAIELAIGRAEEAKLKTASLLREVRGVKELEEEVRAEVLSELRAGAFDPRDGKGKTDKSLRPKEDDYQIQLAIAARTQMRVQEETARALTFANEKLAATASDLDDAFEQVAVGGTAHASQQMKALERDFARAEERMTVGAKEFIGWEAKKQEALARRAAADMLESGRKWKDEDAAADANRTMNQMDRVNAQYDHKRQLDMQQMEFDRRLMEERADLATSEIQKSELDEADKATKILKIRYMLNDATERGARLMTDHLVAIERQRAEALKTPMEKLADQWADVLDQMNNATASWAQRGVDLIMGFVTTGKFEFSKFVESILADILRIQIQAALVKPMQGFLNGIAGGITNMLFGGAGAGAANGSWDSIPTTSAAGNIVGYGGALDLKHYAAGGIARSPQLSIFGEGSMPEAYVPLADGRSIPVTVKNGAAPAAPNVIVNVINQSGQQVEAKQQGAPRFDGRQMILDVVLQAAGSPGPFRDNLRGVMR